MLTRGLLPMAFVPVNAVLMGAVLVRMVVVVWVGDVPPDRRPLHRNTWKTAVNPPRRDTRRHSGPALLSGHVHGRVTFHRPGNPGRPAHGPGPAAAGAGTAGRPPPAARAAMPPCERVGSQVVGHPESGSWPLFATPAGPTRAQMPGAQSHQTPNGGTWSCPRPKVGCHAHATNSRNTRPGASGA